MKKLLPLFLIVALLIVRSEVWAANTYSLDVEMDSSQYLSVVDSATLSVTGDVTLEAWVKFESIDRSGNVVHTVVVKGDLAGGDDDSMYAIQFCPAEACGVDKWRSFFRRTSQNNTLTYNQTPNLAQWYHMAVTRNATTGEILMYQDGTQVANITANTGTTVDNAIAFTIGGNGLANKYFDGRIDDVRLWNVVRTSTQISDNRSVELVGNESGLQVYYKLNNSLLDETINDQDLTNNNSATFVTDVPFGAAVAARIDDYLGAVNSLILVE